MTDTAFEFDTLATARKLRAAGIAQEHAEAHAEAIGAAVRASRDDLATKADLAKLETRLTVRLYGVAAGIVATVIAAALAAVVALINLLPHAAP